MQGENSLVVNFPPVVGNGGKFPTSGGKWWEIIKKFKLVKKIF